MTDYVKLGNNDGIYISSVIVVSHGNLNAISDFRYRMNAFNVTTLSCNISLKFPL